MPRVFLVTHVRKAVVLAAGLGSRLGCHDCPKPLISVNGTPILYRALSNLASVGVREAVIVIGHRAAEISAAVGGRFAGMAISYVLSDRFRTTNNAYSLWLARDHLDEDLFLVEGDVVFDAGVLTQIQSVDAVAVSAIAPWKPGMNGTVAQIDASRRVSQLLLAADQKRAADMSRMFKTVNIHLMREPYLQAEFVPSLKKLISSGGDGECYERVLAQSVERRRFTVHGMDCRDLRWYEVDDTSDLVAAEYLFASVDDRLEMLRGMHGGYWRHDVVDHCLLYNPYFPTPALMEALTIEFSDALINYPVGHAILQQLLGAVVNQPPERVVIANGASELINVCGRVLDNVVLAVPGFNEYEEVFGGAKLARVEVLPPTFRVEVESLHRAAVCAKAQAVIVISPNNPTSIAIPREDLLRLAKLLAERGTLLVVDESFVDFCAGVDSLERDLTDHPNLVVVKSMSKAYGVSGLRLGYLATANLEFASTIRAELPIWNINGFAESFLRLLPRFHQDFQSSLERVRDDRDQLYADLAGIEGLQVWKPDANFILVRVPEPWTGPQVGRALFARSKILVKDCSGKSMREAEKYLRISSRTGPQNCRLVVALAEVLRGVGR